MHAELWACALKKRQENIKPLLYLVKPAIPLHNIADKLVEAGGGDVENCNVHDDQCPAWSDTHTPAPQSTNVKISLIYLGCVCSSIHAFANYYSKQKKILRNIDLRYKNELLSK